MDRTNSPASRSCASDKLSRKEPDISIKASGTASPTTFSSTDAFNRQQFFGPKSLSSEPDTFKNEGSGLLMSDSTGKESSTARRVSWDIRSVTKHTISRKTHSSRSSKYRYLSRSQSQSSDNSTSDDDEVTSHEHSKSFHIFRQLHLSSPWKRNSGKPGTSLPSDMNTNTAIFTRSGSSSAKSVSFTSPRSEPLDGPGLRSTFRPLGLESSSVSSSLNGVQFNPKPILRSRPLTPIDGPCSFPSPLSYVQGSTYLPVPPSVSSFAINYKVGIDPDFRRLSQSDASDTYFFSGGAHIVSYNGISTSRPNTASRLSTVATKGTNSAFSSRPTSPSAVSVHGTGQLSEHVENISNTKTETGSIEFSQPTSSTLEIITSPNTESQKPTWSNNSTLENQLDSNDLPLAMKDTVSSSAVSSPIEIPVRRHTFVLNRKNGIMLVPYTPDRPSNSMESMNNLNDIPSLQSSTKVYSPINEEVKDAFEKIKNHLWSEEDEKTFNRLSSKLSMMETTVNSVPTMNPFVPSDPVSASLIGFNTRAAARTNGSLETSASPLNPIIKKTRANTISSTTRHSTSILFNNFGKKSIEQNLGIEDFKDESAGMEVASVTKPLTPTTTLPLLTSSHQESKYFSKNSMKYSGNYIANYPSKFETGFKTSRWDIPRPTSFRSVGKSERCRPFSAEKKQSLTFEKNDAQDEVLKIPILSFSQRGLVTSSLQPPSLLSVPSLQPAFVSPFIKDSSKILMETEEEYENVVDINHTPLEVIENEMHADSSTASITTDIYGNNEGYRCGDEVNEVSQDLESSMYSYDEYTTGSVAGSGNPLSRRNTRNLSTAASGKLTIGSVLSSSSSQGIVEQAGMEAPSAGNNGSSLIVSLDNTQSQHDAGNQKSFQGGSWISKLGFGKRRKTYDSLSHSSTNGQNYAPPEVDIVVKSEKQELGHKDPNLIPTKELEEVTSPVADPVALDFRNSQNNDCENKGGIEYPTDCLNSVPNSDIPVSQESNTNTFTRKRLPNLRADNTSINIPERPAPIIQPTPVLPPSVYMGKNIILCFDGTSEEFGPGPFTNVLKFFRMLDRTHDEKQIVYYQPGIGTSVKAVSSLSSNGTTIMSTISNAVDAAIAFTLDRHIRQAYEFLMRFYKDGDSVFLIGFSRGAFTARVLSGMIERVGLLCPGLEEIVPTAWNLYKNWEYAGQPARRDGNTLAEEFKYTFSRRSVQIQFMGLWDSVNSVGILYDRMFPQTSNIGSIAHIRHAVSIDERRGKFRQYPFSHVYYSFAGRYNNTSPNTSESSLSTNFEEGKIVSDDEDDLFQANDKAKSGNGYETVGSISASDGRHGRKNVLRKEFEDLYIVETNEGLGTLDISDSRNRSSYSISPKSKREFNPNSKNMPEAKFLVYDDEDIVREKTRLKKQLRDVKTTDIPTAAVASVALDQPNTNNSDDTSNEDKRLGICRSCSKGKGIRIMNRKSENNPQNQNSTVKDRKLPLTQSQLEKLSFFRQVFGGNNNNNEGEFSDSGYSSAEASMSDPTITNNSNPQIASTDGQSKSDSVSVIYCKICGTRCEGQIRSDGLSNAPTPPNSTNTTESLESSFISRPRKLWRRTSSTRSIRSNKSAELKADDECEDCKPQEYDGDYENESAEYVASSQTSLFSTSPVSGITSTSAAASMAAQVADSFNNILWYSGMLDTPSLNEPTRRNVYGMMANSSDEGGLDFGVSGAPNNGGSNRNDVIELWFPGDHSDVGGGWCANEGGALFSDVSLRWMVGETLKNGVIFRQGAVEDYFELRPLLDSLVAPLHDTLDLRLKSNVNDELGRADKSWLSSLFWWLLEVLPIPTYQFNNVKEKWAISSVPNVGRHREVPLDAKFHWSVSWKEAYGTVVEGNSDDLGTGGDDTGDGSEDGGEGKKKKKKKKKKAKIVPYRPPNLTEGHVRVPLSKNAKRFPPDDIAEAKRFKRARGSGSASAAMARRRAKRKRLQQRRGEKMKEERLIQGGTFRSIDE